MRKVQFFLNKDFNINIDGKFWATDFELAKLTSWFTKNTVVRLGCIILTHMLKHPEHYKNVDPAQIDELSNHAKAFTEFYG